MRNFGKFPKINFTTFAILLFSNFLFFLFFYFKAIFKLFSKTFQITLEFGSTPFITINKMQQHVCSHMLLPYDEF